ncbi:MAG: VOC family protein [Caldilineaceae bacterium]|jgi:catechol 2,3-dioxygenase-like lactoylglutathione lyase family enzyme|nr:VOC family protein [Caldilineaceae bacterium]
MHVQLQHVAIARPPGTDAAARAFYGELLGLTEIAPPPSLQTLGVLWYQIGASSELHIFVEEPLGQDRSGRHFCLAVEDVEALRLHLMEAGISVVGDVPIPGRPRYFVRDPFGNLIELTTVKS